MSEFINHCFTTPHILFSIGIVLICLELILSEFFFLWIGLAFVETSSIIFVCSHFKFPAWTHELPFISLIFTTCVSYMLFLGYQRFKNKAVFHIDETLNNRLDNMIGEIVPFHCEDDHSVNGYIIIHDTRWKTMGDTPLPNGSMVKITAFKNNMALVSALKSE